MHRTMLFALAAAAAGTAVAQATARPDPTAPQAKVPPVEYRSAFEGYRPFAEEKVAPWRESNDAVKGAPPKPKPGAKPPADGVHGDHK